MLVVFFVPTPGVADSIGKMKAGERIRAKRDSLMHHYYGDRLQQSDWIVGTLVSFNNDFLRISIAGSADSLAIARGSLARVEKSLGMTTRKRGGQALGLMGGLAAGVGLAIAINRDDFATLEEGLDYRLVQILVVPATAVIGYILGGHIGAAIKHEKWELVWERR